MLALSEAVRETFPADVLQNNGYYHVAALHTLRLSDLEEMGVLRGHARMIMSVLRPGGDPPHTPVASPRNETSIEAPRPAGRYVRCQSFPEATSGSYPARRAWRAFMLEFVVVLRTINWFASTRARYCPRCRSSPLECICIGGCRCLRFGLGCPPFGGGWPEGRRGYVLCPVLGVGVRKDTS